MLLPNLDRGARTALLVGVFMNVKIATLGLANFLFVSSGLFGGWQNSLQASQTAADQKGAPDLNAIIATMEDVQVKNAATMKAYQVTREYKVFHSDDIEPLSTILVLITFTPPASESYVIRQRSGNPRGEKIVRTTSSSFLETTRSRQLPNMCCGLCPRKNGRCYCSARYGWTRTRFGFVASRGCRRRIPQYSSETFISQFSMQISMARGCRYPLTRMPGYCSSEYIQSAPTT
jgi:hypothetical protein